MHLLSGDEVGRSLQEGPQVLALHVDRESPSAQRLQSLMPDLPTLSFPLSIVYPSRRNLPPRTRIVIEFLAELIRADSQ